jgi:hypothetical protein
LVISLKNRNAATGDPTDVNVLAGKATGAYTYAGVASTFTSGYGGPPLKLYAAAEATISASVQRDSMQGTCTAQLTLTGHVEDVPLGKHRDHAAVVSGRAGKSRSTHARFRTSGA